jgi:hypothetical protein
MSNCDCIIRRYVDTRTFISLFLQVLFFCVQYARYLEQRGAGEYDAAREVYRRACTIHLSRKPNPHLAWSAFEEKLGVFVCIYSLSGMHMTTF